MSMQDRQPAEFFYHGTSLEAALSIQDVGFRVDLSGTNAGAMLGPGVYITTTLEKALNYAKVKDHSGVIFKLKVDLGRCYAVRSNSHSECKGWASNGYDSAFAAMGIIGQREEHCVRDASRVQIEDVILGHTGQAQQAGYRVKDGHLQYQFAGIPRVLAQLASPTAGVLLVEHPHAQCNGVYRPCPGLEHGGYPLLINQSGMQMFRHWESGGVWCMKHAARADGFASYSVSTEGDIPTGTTTWWTVTASAGDAATVDGSEHLCTTSLLSDADPTTATVEEVFSQAARAEGHVEAVKSAVGAVVGLAAATAAGAGAVAVAPTALTAGVAVGQGAAIGAVSGAAAARSILCHPMLGIEAKAVLGVSGLSEKEFVMRAAAGGAAFGASRVVAVGAAAAVSAGMALGADLVAAGTAAVASPVVPIALAVLTVTAVATYRQQHPEPESEPAPLDLTASVGEEPIVVRDKEGAEDHVEYEITVRNPATGGEWKIRKRYSEFARLRTELIQLNPVLKHGPDFPDTTWLRSSATDVEVVKTRRELLYSWTKVALRLYPRAAALQDFFHPPTLAVPSSGRVGDTHAVMQGASAPPASLVAEAAISEGLPPNNAPS